MTTDRPTEPVTALEALGRAIDEAPATGPDPVEAAVARIRVGVQVVGAASRPAAGETGAALAVRGRAPRRLRPGPRRLAAAAAAALVVAAVVVAVPASRAAVARLLGIGGVTVVTVDEVPSIVGPYDLGERLDVDDALAAAPGPLVPDHLGRPDAAYAGVPDGAVSVAWRPSDTLPPIVDARVGEGPRSDGQGSAAGLVITAWRDPLRALATKFLGPGTDVEATTVAGRPATWISGAPHVLGPADASEQLVAGGELRVAGNTLLWGDGGVVYRLESALDRAGARALATQLVTAPPG